MFKQTFLCSVSTFLLLKHCKQLLQKYFLFLFFVLWNINLLKSLIKSLMWLVFISYRQQIHWVFKSLILNVDWKNLPTFITKHINANIVLRFNFTKIFFSHRKLNSNMIKIISKFFAILPSLPTFAVLHHCHFAIISKFFAICNSFRMYFYWINMPNMTP